VSPISIDGKVAKEVYVHWLNKQGIYSRPFETDYTTECDGSNTCEEAANDRFTAFNPLIPNFVTLDTAPQPSDIQADMERHGAQAGHSRGQNRGHEAAAAITPSQASSGKSDAPASYNLR
jgi:hypothetical protein